MEIRLNQALEPAREQLGAAAEDAWARGQSMTLDQAFAYALGGDANG
jgi:hypothetical protein